MPAEASESSLDSEKKRLENEKLREEVASLRRGRRNAGAVSTHSTRWLALGLSVVTLGAAGFGLLQTVSTYFAKQDREYAFQVSRELIALTQQLASNKEHESASAALLLSSFEEDAVGRILLANLQNTVTPNLSKHIADALRLLVSKMKWRDDATSILEPLFAQTARTMKEQLSRADPNLAVIHNHLDAIDALYDRPWSGDSRQRLEDLTILYADLPRTTDTIILNARITEMLDAAR